MTTSRTVTSRFTALVVAVFVSSLLTADTQADVFDVSEGAVVVDNSPLFAGEVPEEMLGLTPDTGPEFGALIFADSADAGTVHYVEWTMPEPILVRRINLRAIADSCTTDRRTIEHFRLLAVNDGAADDVLVDEAVPVPYNYEFDCSVLFTRTIPQTTAARFRAEFTQFRDGGFSGPRIVELDGFAFGVCADTVNDDGLVTATDALSILTRAVSGSFCEHCLCDATNDGQVTATDALAALRGAIGQTENLNCPPCGS